MPIHALVFAAVVGTLYAAHHLADHVLGQTERQATNKADKGWVGWSNLLGHVALYHLVMVAMLVVTVVLLHLPVTVIGIACGVLFSLVTHTILDRRWPVAWVLRHTGSADFVDRTSPICGMYLADQSLHIACVWISALLIACL